MGPGSAATLPQGQLRPYPCQGSAATLPTRILWKGQRFLPLSRVSCDPTWPQCKESYRFSHCFEVIQVQVQHSFYQFFPPFWQHMLSMIDFSPLLVTHAFNDSGSRATFLLSIFSPPLGNPCFQWFRFQYNIPFIKNFPPLGNPCFQWFKFKYNILFINFSPPPPWQPMLCDPTWQHSVHQIFPPLGNPCFQWFKFKYNIPFNKIFPPPWQPTPCDPTWQHSFFQISPPLATHAFNDWSSNTTFLLSNFSPPWQPMLSMIQVQVQHSFFQNFSPPPWQPMPCDPTWQHSFYQIFPPLGNPCFQWLKFEYNIPFINFSPPPWQPMLCDPTWQHSVHQIFPPLATHAFNDSSSSTTFLLTKFFPPFATHALRPYLTTFLLSNFPTLGNPCFQWFKFEYNIPFIKFFPPLATHAFNDSSSSTTFLLTKFSPLGNPRFATLPDNTFYQIFPPLGNTCFQWFKFEYNVPFIKFSPPPFGNPCFAPTWQHSPPPPWQPMLPMIQIQVQHSFYQNSPPPPLATHAVRPYLPKFLLSDFPSPPPWQPMLCDPTWQHSPPLATHAFNDSNSSTTFLLSKNFPPPWQPMLCDPTWQHSFYQIFPPLGNPCFQWFKFKYNIPFIKIFPRLGNPCFATLPDKNSFFQIFPPWQPMLSMIQVRVPHSFYQIFPPPPLATHAFNDSSSSTTFLLSIFPPPWQPMLCDPTWQNSFFSNFPPLATHAFNDSSSSTTFLLSNFSPPLGNTCFQWFKFEYNIPFINFSPLLATHALRPYLTTFPPPWQPMLPMIQIQVQHSFYQNFSPPLETHAVRPYLTTFLLSNFPPVKQQPASQHHAKKPDILFCDPTQLLFPINSSEHR